MDKEKIWSNKNVVLLMNAKNAIDRWYEKWRSFERNVNYKETPHNNHIETTKIFGTHNKERKFSEFNRTH